MDSMWLIILDRLMTKERVARWGVLNDDTCAVCANEVEIRENMFFLHCRYAREVWKLMLKQLQLCRCPITWHELILWLCRITKGKSAKAKFGRAAIMAMFYCLWIARNFLIFNGELKMPEEVQGLAWRTAMLRVELPKAWQ
ncbi:hypothetical protein Droror1_Dr00019996 [Drosera rotundifolia]